MSGAGAAQCCGLLAIVGPRSDGRGCRHSGVDHAGWFGDMVLTRQERQGGTTPAGAGTPVPPTTAGMHTTMEWRGSSGSRTCRRCQRRAGRGPAKHHPPATRAGRAQHFIRPPPSCATTSEADWRTPLASGPSTPLSRLHGWDNCRGLGQRVDLCSAERRPRGSARSFGFALVAPVSGAVYGWPPAGRPRPADRVPRG